MAAKESEIIHLSKYLILNYDFTSGEKFSLKGYNLLVGGGVKL
jgi:hypothetical protein